jgi:tetratricopeptide (TPR) repeat protein
MRIAIGKLAVISSLLFGGVGLAAGSSPSRWMEARSTHFVVLTDSSERDARRLTSQFERMHLVFHTLFPTKGDDSDPPIVVLALKDKKGMEALEPAAYLGKGKVDLTGFFVRAPEKNYILVRLDVKGDHAFSTVYHEYTHYMLRKAASLPLWLNEGLAQFYENTDIDEKHAWLGQANAHRLRYLNRNDLLPIATLLATNNRSPEYQDEQKGSVFYAESWALTHFLIVGDRLAGTHRIHDYGQMLARGEDPVTAARQAFGDLNKLQQGLDSYLMQRRFMYFMLPATLPAKDAAFVVRPVRIAEADAMRADVLVYTDRTNEARALLKDVLRDDPGNALAHETMGALRFREDDVAGAKKWYGEAAALDPENYLADYYYARLAMYGGDKAEDAAIESNLRAAIRLNPEFAPAYDALAMFYTSRERKLDEAYGLSVRAVELDPGSLAYVVDCAEVLTEQRQFAGALEMLAAAKRLAKTPYEVDAVELRVARVGRRQSAQAGSLGRTMNVSLEMLAGHESAAPDAETAGVDGIGQ